MSGGRHPEAASWAGAEGAGPRVRAGLPSHASVVVSRKPPGDSGLCSWPGGLRLRRGSARRPPDSPLGRCRSPGLAPPGWALVGVGVGVCASLRKACSRGDPFSPPRLGRLLRPPSPLASSRVSALVSLSLNPGSPPLLPCGLSCLISGHFGTHVCLHLYFSLSVCLSVSHSPSLLPFPVGLTPDVLGMPGKKAGPLSSPPAPHSAPSPSAHPCAVAFSSRK